MFNVIIILTENILLFVYLLFKFITFKSAKTFLMATTINLKDEMMK